MGVADGRTVDLCRGGRVGVARRVPAGAAERCARHHGGHGRGGGYQRGGGPGPCRRCPDILALILSAATASVLGDLVAYRLAWRGGERLDRAIARSRRLTTPQERLGDALARGGGALVVLARFAPPAAPVVSFCAGAAHRRARELPALVRPWPACPGPPYSVALGYYGAQWLGSGPALATGVSVAALFGGGRGGGLPGPRARPPPEGGPPRRPEGVGNRAGHHGRAGYPPDARSP